MKKRIISLLLSMTCLCMAACGTEADNNPAREETSSNTEINGTIDESSASSEIKDTIGKKAKDLSTPVKKVIFDGGSTKSILALSDANGLYGIGYGSYGEFGIEAEELSSITLIAKDVVSCNSNIQYIDSNGDFYWSGLWYEGGVVSSFEKVDTNIRCFNSIMFASIGLTTDNEWRFYCDDPDMSNLNDEVIKEFEVIENVKYPLIGYYCTGYVTMDGDVYMKNKRDETTKILSGVTKYEPICDFGEIYFLTDDGVLYSYELEGDDITNDNLLFEIDSDVISFSPEAYVKSNGEVYVFDEDEKRLLTDKHPGAEMSNVQEVLYESGDLIYTTKDNKIAHTYYSKDENKYVMKEYDCTLGGVQELFNALQED